MNRKLTNKYIFRYLLSFFLFFLAFIQISHKAKAAQAPVAVVVYDKEAQSGESMQIRVDMPSLKGMDKRMRSFKVSPGFRVRFFSEENFQGKYYTRQSNDKYGDDAKGWGLQISSVKILSAPYASSMPNLENSSVVAITIYDGMNLTGESLNIYSDTASFGNMNKRLSSYKVTPGFKARFFSEENYRGGYYTREGNKQKEINAKGWDNKVSSVRILAAPALEPDSPSVGITPFIPGETQVSNGEIVSYNGQCFSAKNNPSVWETPSESSWFWDLVDCNGATDPVPPAPNPETVTPFIPGETQVSNGEIVSYNGQCFSAKNNPSVWETPSESSWFWDLVDCNGATDPVPPAPNPETGTNIAPKVSFITPSNGSTLALNETISISVNAFDDNDNLSQVIIEADGQHICDFNTSATLQFRCDWTALVTDNIKLKATAIDDEYLSSSAEIMLTVNDTQPPPVEPTPDPDIAGGLCKNFNIYPNWTRETHAISGDVMVHDNIAYSAGYWTQSIPGSDGSWNFHLNCDGSLPGSAPLLSLQNPSDPISLALPYWSNTLVVASPSSISKDIVEVQASNSENLTKSNALTASFTNVMNSVKTAGYSTIILKSDVLDHAIKDKKRFNNIPVKDALSKSAQLNQVDISAAQINALSDDLKGWAQAHHLIIQALAPTANYGWQLTLGDFAYESLAGRRSVWNKASSHTAELLNELELYKVDQQNRANFIAFHKSSTTRAYTHDQWHNALEYIKQVTDYIKAPAMLHSVPTNQATNYFMGETNAERQIRKAAYHNVFGIIFDKDSYELEKKINGYHKAKVPLYSMGSSSNDNALTIIPELNRQLAAAEQVMDNEVFLFETPESEWIPSTVYKWADFLDGLNAMHNTGVAGNKYWLLDRNANNATNIKYAKVAIAAFLAQSMQETIRYNACDENNWSETRYGAPTNYPMSASCGQLGQKYADYGYNSVTGVDHPYSCPRDNKMEVSAATNAKWYGAPAPVFAAPDAVLKEMGLLVNGYAGRWTNEGHCNTVPEQTDSSKQVWERDDCKVYTGQKAGKFIWDGSSQESVQGCGWWGRGVIQTTGRQNFGTLNHFLGRSHVNPDLIGQVIGGVRVEAPPANPLYPELDFCSNPGLICSSEQSKEIKWIAGLFYWVTSVQAYSNEGGPYNDWNYFNELKKYVDGGLRGNEFIDDVSGIVNRGCPDSVCETGEVHAITERRENFRLVLEKLGLRPQ